jgi:hypothetical protein
MARWLSTPEAWPGGFIGAECSAREKGIAAQPMDEGAKNRVGKVHARCLIGKAAHDTTRCPILGLVRHHDAAGRLRDIVVAGVMGARPLWSKHAAGGEDQRRIDGLEVFVADAEPLHRAGAEVFSHDIDGARQTKHHSAAVGLAQVQAEAALVAVQRLEVGTEAVLVDTQPAAGVAARLLNFDHVRAQVSEQQRGPRALLKAREIENAETV